MLTLHAPLPYTLDDPLEQGGLLLGTLTAAGATVHHATAPQPDDDRGTHHLTLCGAGHVREAEAALARGLVYLGYWHSHPAGTPPIPSDVDLTDFRVAVETMDAKSLYFPIVTGGVLHAYRFHRSGQLEEVPWTLQPSPPPS